MSDSNSTGIPAGMPVLMSHPKDLPVDPEKPFLIGIEYYRPPVPPRELWDADFARIKDAGFHIIRTFPYWNWIEPAPGRFEFDDLDLFMDLAQKHGLASWIDTTVATHGACPEWMTRRHPDMVVVRRDGSRQYPVAGNAAPQGYMIHNTDHPKWRQYTERFLKAIVGRYRDHPAMSIWGTWDGVNFAGAWSGGEGYPPYKDYTIEKYRRWLKARYTLEELNERFLRRYRNWKDVDPPRRKTNMVEMSLYLRFHYENLADQLGWIAHTIDTLDGKHEQRSHGWFTPRRQDEVVSPYTDSWGLSMPSAGRLTGDDPYRVSHCCLGFQWARAIARNGRWWNEEIHAAARTFPGKGRNTIAEEDTIFLWLSLIEGAVGTLYWQYRPEYLSFEGPGINLAALDGTPTPRWDAVKEAIRRIRSLSPHLPLEIPRAKTAVAYSAPSHEIFWDADIEESFNSNIQGIYRSLWADNVPLEVVSPSIDWSGFQAVFLSCFARLDAAAISRIRECLTAGNGPTLVADGHFGTLCEKGHWSFSPPEGLGDLIDIRVEEFDRVTDKDILEGRNLLETKFGTLTVTHECDYLVLKPQGNAEVIATLGDRVIGVRSGNFTWFGFTLTEGFGGAAPAELLRPLIGSLDISRPVSIEGDPVVVFRRTSAKGGNLVFILNLEQRTARARVSPVWGLTEALDAETGRKISVADGAFRVEVPFGDVSIIHCP